MIRDIDALTSRQFDLLVVGGGIYGLMAAWDAAARGLHVALLERQDFGSGASFNHHRTLHGGLRYLQSADLARLRESVRERRGWAHMAPHLVAPQAFAIAAGASGKPPWLLRAGFLADTFLSLRRNRDLPPSLQLPRARVVSADSRADLDTGDLLPAGPLGVWYDYRTEHAERLTLAVAMAATSAGALLVNYVDAVEPLKGDRRIVGMVAHDAVSGRRFQVRARTTINAAGAAAGRVMAGFGVRRPLPLVKALNVVTRRPAPAVACGAPTASGRLLFALPWQGRLSIGTWHGPELCGADARVTARDLEDFLAEINEAFPKLGLSFDDLTLVQRGIVPARQSRAGIDLADRPFIREHRRDGIEGAITMVGVKYTTARAVAEHVVALVMKQAGHRAEAPQSAHRRLPGARSAEGDRMVPAIDPGAWQHLQHVYGTHASRVAGTAAIATELAARIIPRLPVIGAAIVEGVRNEMAITLEDVILRRTGLGSAGYPGDEAVVRVASIIRGELGWSEPRIAEEIQALKDFYLPLKV